MMTDDEKLLVGYRWYDQHNATPAFAFGHGLSYSTFDYTNLEVSSSNGPLGLAVSVDVANSGAVEGAEVVQLYLSFPAQAGEPPQQLKGFQKVQLSPTTTANPDGVSKATISFALTDRSVSIWDVETHGWSKVAGRFGVCVGSSSRDMRACTTMVVS